MSDKSLLGEYLDGLSAREARKIIEELARVFEFRPANIRETPGAETGKQPARASMKALAEILAGTDADWMVRECLLNLGRVLYYSNSPPHPYYRQGLIDVLQRAANELRQPTLGEAVCGAIEQHQKLISETEGAVFSVGDVFKSNANVVSQASTIVSSILDKTGASFFTRSERKLLTGLVNPTVARRLNEG